MKETEFNLLDEPWIRVMDAQCRVRELSLTDVLLHAHEYQSLSGELPTQDVAVLRLLLAVLHTVFARMDMQGNPHRLEDKDEAVEFWQELWKNGKLPEQPIRTYLEQWHERFWLFHPERPFAQVAELTYGTGYEASKLNGEISESSNKKRLFSSYTGAEKEQLTYAQAARWLIHLNSVDDSAIKPSKEGKAASATGKLESAGTGWFGKIGLTVLKGETLFQTLLLNFVLDHTSEISVQQCPVWEREKITLDEAKEIPKIDNLAELYTIPSRKIKLIRAMDKVTGFYAIKGEFFSEEVGLIEPMTAWRKISKKNQADRLMPYMHQFGRQMWRDFSVLFSQTVDEGFKPQVVEWYNTLLGYENLALMLPKFICMETVGINYDSQKCKITNIFSDSLSLHAKILLELGKAWRSDIILEIEKCESLAQATGYLAENLYLAGGGNQSDAQSSKKQLRKIRDAAKEQLYYRLDMPFRTWLSSIDPDADGEKSRNLLEQWQKTAQKIAIDYAQEQADHASDTALIGHSIGRDGEKKRLYAAPKAMRIFRAAVSKIYKKFKEVNT